MLAFDGVSVMATASLNYWKEHRQQIPTSEQLQQEIRTFTGTKPYPGITGSIAFDNAGDAAYKPVLVLLFDKNGHTQVEYIQGCLQRCSTS